MSPSDLIVLLLLSANVHTSLVGDDKSVTGGLIGALTLICANFALNHFAFKSKKFETFAKGEPELIISRGRPCLKTMNRHRLTLAQLETAIRKEGVRTLAEVKLGILEPDGTISIIKDEAA